MTTQTAAKSGFQKWVRGLNPVTLSDDEKRLLHICLDHFDELAKLGTAQGKRASRIGELIGAKGTTLPATMPEVPAATATPADAIQALAEMTIGPFRGFTAAEPFTFDRPYAFIYGPNGSGKSSFCEGLEYALIGTIAEAEAKRIEVASYVRNERTNRGDRPKVKARSASGAMAQVTPSDVHRFSFIEKNRIEAFARISATSEKVQADRISTLFGLDQFTEFVNGFTETFDQRHLKPLENELTNEVATRKALIEQLRASLNAAKVDVEKIPSEIAALLAEVGAPEGSTLEAVLAHLNGVDGDGGRFSLLLAKKSNSVPIDLDVAALGRATESYKKLAQLLTSIRQKEETLSASASQVKFGKLYEAVRSIAEDDNAETAICPACKTPLASTAANPFDHARDELAKMEALARLQDEITQEVASVGDGVRALNVEITTVNEIRMALAPSAVPHPSASQLAHGAEADREAGLLSLCAELNAFASAVAEFPALTAGILSHNAALALRRAEQTHVDSDLAAVNRLVAKHAALAERRKAAVAKVTSLEKQIADQLLLLEPLEKKQLETQVVVDRNLAYQTAYKSLRAKLVEYHGSLPASLSAGLADQAMKFYNEINRNDPEFHKLAELRLPVAANGKIEVKLRGETRALDALHILSEGHIRCLGLAILLAKVVQLDRKFIIYDDIVNAIDEDHRDGIASLLLEDPLLKDRQQIITCHGEFFIQKLASKLGASKMDKMVCNFRFTPADLATELGIQVSSGKATHYVTLARQAFIANSLKDCLAQSRRAVEATAESLWKKLNAGLGVMLTVKMRAASAPPDLSSVITGIAAAIKNLPFAPESTVKQDLETLSTKYFNLLLNKGTHHQGDLSEFERADAKLLVELIERMDIEVMNLKFSGTAVPVVKQ